MTSFENVFLSTGSKTPEIAILGECMIELSGKPLQALQQGFAGDTLNTALYLNRLTKSQEVKLNYATCLGTDAFSEAMINQWTDEGISCDYIVQLEDKNPGIYFIQVDDTGERSFSYWRNDSAARQYLENDQSETILKAIPNFALLYISGISLAILPASSREKLLQAIVKMRDNGGKLAFDNNYRPKLWASAQEARETYSQFLAHCDLALLTVDDEKMLYPEEEQQSLLDRHRLAGVTEIVLKKGAEPCYVEINGDGQVEYSVEVPAQLVARVVDTTAAGDSFSAGYIAARIQGANPELAAKWGHKLAATVIQHPGAIMPVEAMPDLAAIK